MKPIVPTVKMSKVDHLGQFNMRFSEAMNVIGLVNNSYVESDNPKYKYFLSEAQMTLKVKSGGVVNDTVLKFEWYAINITDTLITYQILFENPIKISSVPGRPEIISLHLLQSSMKYFHTIDQITKKGTSENSRLLSESENPRFLKNPLATFSSTLSIQAK